jgi:hypothetical protein
MHSVLPAAVVSLLLLAGCASQPVYTQAQLNAIETRSVEADFDETLDAASGALFDAGYIIAMSDREGGLITGTQTMQDTGWAAFWGTAPYFRSLAISIQIRSDTPDRSLVRIKTQVNGQTRVDKTAIEKIWVLMQRQVMMSATPHIDQGVSGSTSP